jgi:hypothetical protein
MSISSRYTNNTLPEKGVEVTETSLLVYPYGRELKERMCTKYGFKAVAITPELAKAHGFTKGTTECLLAPSMSYFKRCFFADNIRTSKNIEIDLAKKYEH